MEVDGALSRRALLKGAGLAFLAGGVAACSAGTPAVTEVSAVTRPLPIPPILAPSTRRKTKTFRLTAQAGTSEILAGARTATWGYNGSQLGPTIRVARGDDVRIKVVNGLRESTTVHWHGLHTPPEMDGGPDQPIAPGRGWEARFRVRQQAATLWYHPNARGSMTRQIHRGLAGMLIVDDAASARLDLPKEYGVDDVPLILQDKLFTADHSLDEKIDPDVGIVGETVTVNGIASPTFTARTRRVRFRIVDAATARVVNLAFSDDRRFTIIASDGGLLDEPQTVSSMLLSPGERAEIVVDLIPGETLTLRTVPFAASIGLGDDAPDIGQLDELDLMTIVGPPPTTSTAPALPSALNPTVRTSPSVGMAKRRFVDLQWFQINGQIADPHRTDAVVAVGAYERWTVRNRDSRVENLHIHGTQFRVLSAGGTASRVQTSGWKDTVLVPPGARMDLAVRFIDYTSTRVPYVFGSQLALNNDQGMEGRLLVVRPGSTVADARGRRPKRPKPR
ncbi:multicopper oxidase [Gordonia spumicola]|uniref:Multicopper oxidase n=1 Tax=Gordonia spumicola TaxID=589161 RepID=A0A7I9V797_9ACTN|nr:multicopper oxidase domain-containing protein [Gordonia spumicola]GEE01266.1 multicopper oxidase [Gordonia spumicola]